MNKNSVLKYKKLTQREHVLKRGGMYFGSQTTEPKDMWIPDSLDVTNITITNKQVNYNAAFYKCFDEAISNASDHAIRTGKVKYIKIWVTDDSVCIENDGPGVPVQIHPEEKIWAPEMIFGHLLTGENYEDDEIRDISGQNGLGIKITNIYSKKFLLETADGKKTYYQEFLENLSIINKPKMSKSKASFTKVTYFPDFEKFGMKSIDDDTKLIFLKRCIDVAVYNLGIKVYFNDKLINIKSVNDYIKMHLKDTPDLFVEKLQNGWTIGITKSPSDQFEQISIVNGTSTFRGGTHVNWISNALSKSISESFGKKIKVTWPDVKNKLFIFLICRVPNPSYDSQSKECLTNYISKDIHQDSAVSENTLKKIMKSDIVQSILDAIALKEQMELKKMQNTMSKVKVEKLVDASSKNRKECQLFIFEGQSAGEAARDHRTAQNQAIFYLRGKFINATEKSFKDIMENKEASNLMSAIGLRLGERPKKEDIRYGEILINTDMDVDGDSIVGLLLNFFYMWPELFEWGLIYRCLTPLMVLYKGKEKHYIFSNKEFTDFCQKKDISQYRIKYKKGLGSLLDEEYAELVNNPKKMKITPDELSKEKLNVWFGNSADLRKNELLRNE
jgi:DNA topoisomerase-2